MMKYALAEAREPGRPSVVADQVDAVGRQQLLEQLEVVARDAAVRLVDGVDQKKPHTQRGHLLATHRSERIAGRPGVTKAGARGGPCDR